MEFGVEPICRVLSQHGIKIARSPTTRLGPVALRGDGSAMRNWSRSWLRSESGRS